MKSTQLCRWCRYICVDAVDSAVATKRHSCVEGVGSAVSINRFSCSEGVDSAVALTFVRLGDTICHMNEESNPLLYALTPNLGRPAKSVGVGRSDAAAECRNAKFQLGCQEEASRK